MIKPDFLVLFSVFKFISFLSFFPISVFGDKLSSDDFYDREKVQEIYLEISELNLRKMNEALPVRKFVPATLQWRNINLKNVGVRYKGNSSSRINQKHKRGYLIKVNEFKKGERFFKLRRIALDNGVQFGSLFSEPIVTDILRDLNIPSSRFNYAKLYINNEYKGVYGNVERIDESFIKSQFGSKSGALFKVHMPGPGANFAYVGDDITQYKKGFEAKNKVAEKSFDELIKFIQVADKSDKPKYEEMLNKYLMLDHFLKITAVMLFSGCFDQLTGWNPHNYYLYRNPKTDLWSYIPWDLDVGFADRAFGRIPVVDGWHAAWPIPGGPPKPILENIVTDSNLLRKYRETASLILEKYFKPESLHSRFDSLYSLIRHDLERDPFPKRRITNPDDKGYDDILNKLKQFSTRRYKLARKQLDSPGQRPKPHPGYKPKDHRNPNPGNAPNGPTNLQLISFNQNKVKLQWKDNAENEAGHIVQRASLETNWEFRNHIPRPGGSEIQALDDRVIMGRKYRYRVYAVFQSQNGMIGSQPSGIVEITSKKTIK